MARSNIRGAVADLASQRPSSILQTALPYLSALDRERAQAVMRAFQQLEILQHEGVVLMAPEILVR